MQPWLLETSHAGLDGTNILFLLSSTDCVERPYTPCTDHRTEFTHPTTPSTVTHLLNMEGLICIARATLNHSITLSMKVDESRHRDEPPQNRPRRIG